MKVRSIRIEDETWKAIKELAERRKVKIATLLKLLVENYKRIERKKIIPEKPILSESEAKDLLKITKELRKELGYRV